MVAEVFKTFSIRLIGGAIMGIDILGDMIGIGIVFLVITSVLVPMVKGRIGFGQAQSPPRAEIQPGIEHGEDSYEGVPYYYLHDKGTDKKPPEYRIMFPCTTPGNFIIRRETKSDRFFKKLGISVEMATHDPTFDDTFYIDSKTVPFTRDFLEKPENREAVRTLFSFGFTSLEHNGAFIVLTWKNFPRGQQIEAAAREKVAEQMAILNRGLMKIPSYKTGFTAARFKQFLVFGITGLVSITGIIAFITGRNHYTPLDMWQVFFKSLSVSVPLFFLFILVSLFLLRGRSSSHRELISVFLITLFTFPMAGFGYGVFFNGALDKDPPTPYQVLVLGKHKSGGKNTAYYAEVESWRENENTELVGISRQLYQQLEPRSSKIIITTKPGKFGFEYIISRRIL